MLQQVRNSVGDDASLAASRACQHQQWPVDVRDGLFLRCGQALKDRVHGVVKSKRNLAGNWPHNDDVLNVRTTSPNTAIV